jgi:hypothetical protein
MAKNASKTGLDYTNVLTNSHNEEAGALNIVDVGSFVPARYGKVLLEYNVDGTISKVDYLSNGVYQETRVVCNADSVGSAHKTTVNFTGRTPQLLAGKAFVVYDAIGATAIWFNMDESNLEPVVPSTYRSIEIKISSLDNPSTIASITAQKIHDDPLFIAMYSLQYTIISVANAGLRLDSYDVNSGVSLKNTPGSNAQTLNNKVWYLNSGGNLQQYYIWYNVSGTGTDPLISGKTGIAVPVPLGATASTVATNTKIALENTQKFTVIAKDDTLLITNNNVGVCTAAAEGNSNFVIFVQKSGEDRELLVTLLLGYNSNGELISVERP